jgi:hypothetical protein
MIFLRRVILIAFWSLGVLGAILLAIPLNWILGERRHSGALATVAGVMGIVFVAAAQITLHWLRKRQFAEGARPGFPVASFKGPENL